MEKLLSNWCKVETVPESYVLPPERRPGKLVFPTCNSIPVIDLAGLGFNRNEVIQQILEASQDYGFFQLINHGVSEELMQDVLKIAKEFFDLPAEDKARFYSDVGKSLDECRLTHSLAYGTEQIHYWRDYFRHPCHPLDKYLELWPQNPSRYREVVGRYSVEVRRLGMRLLNLIAEGLGLESGYFEGELSQKQLMVLNHYPPCPDPSLVLGLPHHCDPYLLTLLSQGDVNGLQVLKDEDWLTVEPIPNAFVVNINHALQVVSNGRLKSANHRAVTNSSVARFSVVSFIHPTGDAHIEPAKSVINESNPALYKAFKYGDFLRTYLECTQAGGDPLQNYIMGS